MIDSDHKDKDTLQDTLKPGSSGDLSHVLLSVSSLKGLADDRLQKRYLSGCGSGDGDLQWDWERLPPFDQHHRLVSGYPSPQQPEHGPIHEEVYPLEQVPSHSPEYACGSERTGPPRTRPKQQQDIYSIDGPMTQPPTEAYISNVSPHDLQISHQEDKMYAPYKLVPPPPVQEYPPYGGLNEAHIDHQQGQVYSSHELPCGCGYRNAV